LPRAFILSNYRGDKKPLYFFAVHGGANYNLPVCLGINLNPASRPVATGIKNDSCAFVSAELYAIMCRVKQRHDYRKKSRKSNDRAGRIPRPEKRFISGCAICERVISPSREIDRIAADRKKLIITHARFHRADRGECGECH